MDQKVLIVDDEKEVRDLIAQYLRQEYLQVEYAGGGREALAKLGLEAETAEPSCPYDLLVLDIIRGWMGEAKRLPKEDRRLRPWPEDKLRTRSEKGGLYPKNPERRQEG
jgi:CheY-like chemotaxis protein